MIIFANSSINSVSIAKRLLISKASVSQMEEKLSDDGLILKNRYDSPSLTHRGKKYCEMLQGLIELLDQKICIPFLEGEEKNRILLSVILQLSDEGLISLQQTTI